MIGLFIFGLLLCCYYGFLKYCRRAVSFSQYFLYFGIFLMIYSGWELVGFFSIWDYLPKALRRLIDALILLFVMMYVFYIYACVKRSRAKIHRQPTVILVCGAGLFGDRLSLSLKTRLDRTIALSSQYPQAKIIVSGGQGPNEWLSEGEAMKQYLIENGIDQNSIFTEEKSTSTYENLLFSMQLYDLDNQTVALVSNQFHLYRLEMIAHKLGIEGFGVAAMLPSIAAPVFYTREFFAFLKGIIHREI